MEGLGLCVITLLISSVFQKAHPVRVTVRETSVQVLRGDSVLLPCSFVTMATLSRLNIIWTVTPLSEPSSPSQVIVYDRGQVIESPSLIGRVSFRSVSLSADIVLNSTRLSDAGTYRCVVNNPPEPGAPGIGELSLSILAPPSSPLCLWDGRADEGDSISLSCSVEEGVPVPELRWDKLEPDQISLPVNKEVSILQGSSEGVLCNRPAMSYHIVNTSQLLLPCPLSTSCPILRVSLDREVGLVFSSLPPYSFLSPLTSPPPNLSLGLSSTPGSLKGTVRILNISAQNSGLYRCTVSNPLGTEACSVELSVYSTSHGASGILQAVSLTLCMALVLLALLALVLWFHRSGHDRKWREEGEEEECYNEIRGNALSQ